jgi:VWFA-related protein
MAIAASSLLVAHTPPRVIRLTVSVLDKKHHAVTGLTRGDFKITDDDKPQSITEFRFVETAGAINQAPATHAAGTASWLRDVPSDVVSNALPPQGRLFVLVLDDALVPESQTVIENEKNIGKALIDRLGPADHMAILFTSGQPPVAFTADRAPLEAAVNGIAPGLMAWRLELMGGIGPNDRSLFKRSLQTVDDATNAVIGAADRTTLVYVTPGVPVKDNLDSLPGLNTLGTDMLPSSLRAPDPNVVGDIAQRPSLGQLSAIHRLHEELALDWKNLLRDARRVNVPVYTIDPCGKRGLGGALMPYANAIADASAVRGQSLAVDLARLLDNAASDYLTSTPLISGGRAIMKIDDVGPSLTAMMEESAGRYVIGYAPTGPRSKFHQVKVAVRRSDLAVLAPSGYYDDADPTPAARLEADLPVTGIPLRAGVIPVASTAGSPSAIVGVLDLQRPALAPTAVEAIEVSLEAFAMNAPPSWTPFGQLSSGPRPLETADAVRGTIKVSAPPDGVADATVEWLDQLELPPGRYRVRLSARSRATNLVGTVFTSVEVPDAGAAQSLSNVVLSTDRHPPRVARVDVTSLGLPAIPSIQREFVAADAAEASVRVYGAASRSMDVVFQLTDTAGAVAWAQTTSTVSTTAGSERVADAHVALPLRQVSAGEYLLTAMVSGSPETLTRGVRLTIK